MVRCWVLCALFLHANGYEDVSLMQQSATHMERVSTGEFQSALNQIKQRVQEVKFPQAEHQMAITALMQEVSQKTEIDDAAIATINEILTLLEGILSLMRGEKTEDQTELDLVLTAVADCGTPTADLTEDDELETNMTSSRTDHITCRGEESLANDDMLLKCGELYSELDLALKPSVPTCNSIPTDTTVSNLDAWNSWFNTATTASDSRRQAWLDEAPPCQNAIQALADKKVLCDAAQGSFEMKFCLWRRHRVIMCNDIDSCYNHETGEHATRVADVKPVADQRTREAVLIEHIKCLLTNLKAENTNTQDCIDATAAADASYQSQYNVTYPDVPAKPSCRDLSVTTPYPGEAAFPTDDNSGYDGVYGVIAVRGPCAPII